VAINVQAIGKTYPAVQYAVGREKIREFAAAVGESNPLHLELEVARAAGYPDLVAPPMFAVVYAGRAVVPALFDPELEINFAMLLHGGQEFVWGPVVLAGDEITTTATVKDVTERAGLRFFVFESVSENQRGESVCTGAWTHIVREG